jgi:hypothetical protein
VSALSSIEYVDGSGTDPLKTLGAMYICGPAAGVAWAGVVIELLHPPSKAIDDTAAKAAHMYRPHLPPTNRCPSRFPNKDTFLEFITIS